MRISKGRRLKIDGPFFQYMSPSPKMNADNLWSAIPPRMIFGWKAILRNWNSPTTSQPYIQKLRDNLRATVDPTYISTSPFTHFYKYLNAEQEGLAWFLYECSILPRHYNGPLGDRSGYLILDLIKKGVELIPTVDIAFPCFPDAPQCTIREYIQNNFNRHELTIINLSERLVMTEHDAAEAIVSSAATATLREQIWTRRHPAAAPAPAPPATVAAPVAPAPTPPAPAPAAPLGSISIRLVRDDDDDTKDDIIRIQSTAPDTYSFTYTDQESDHITCRKGMTGDAVIRHLSLTFRLLLIDEYPYKAIQFTCPTLPPIILSPENLSAENRTLMYDTVEELMRNWPELIRNGGAV